MSSVVVAQQQYSGPIPPASELIKYNDACNNAADRIIAMAEEQAKHRQAMEKTEMDNRLTTVKFSMVCSTLCVVVLSGVIAFAIYKGETNAAIGTCIAAIASVSGIFLYHKKKE